MAMEGDHTWIWMGVPIILLFVNLLFPRSRLLKALALILLVIAAGFRAFSGHNEIDRSLRAIEFWFSPGNPLMTHETVAGWIGPIRRAVTWYGFDLWLGLALGVFFASVPCDILNRWRSHTAKQRT
jgi:hypothetical protein